MATRNFVPRSGSEGQIGTSAKPWGVVVADIGHFATVSGSISGSVTSTGSLGSLIVDGASIDFSNLPTSDPGIAGRVFRQGTDLKISTGGV